MKDSLDAAYGRIGKQVSIPGFRKGKVPARIIEQRFGRGAVLEEAVNDALPKAYDEAVREHKVIPVGQPTVDVTEIEDGKHLAFTAEVDVRPEFDLPEFSSLRVEVGNAVPNDDDVTTQVDSLRARFATLKDVERAAADGDVLLVDIAGATPEGDAVDDLIGNALSYELGTEGMLPGFDEAVRGAKTGDTRSFEFTPQNGDWVGIPLTVNVEVKGVRERELPALDDDFAQLASEFDTVAELQDDVKNRLLRLKRLEQGAEARNKVHEVLIESSPQRLRLTSRMATTAARSIAPRSSSRPARHSRASSSSTRSPSRRKSPLVSPSCRHGWCSRLRATAWAPISSPRRSSRPARFRWPSRTSAAPRPLRSFSSRRLLSMLTAMPSISRLSMPNSTGHSLPSSTT